jgi:metal-responsive CopG/Arc/MetJ family transcriptional regulator
MVKQSINISMDKDLLEQIDNLLEKNKHLNRSSFVQYCVSKVLRSLRGKEFADVEV